MRCMSSPVIQLLISGEDFLCRRHLDAQLKKLVDPSMKDFNFERLSAREVKAEWIINSLNTAPMMAEHRVIVVDDLEALSKEDQEKLAGYFQNPNPQTHLFLVGEKVDKRTAFFKALEKTADVVEFKPIYENQLPRFVMEEARRLSLTIDASAATLLASLVGRDLGSLVSELEKLALFVHPEKTIRERHVIDLVSAGLVDNIFQITNLIGSKKYAAAHALMTRMQEQGEAVVKVVALVINHFRKLLLAKSHLEKNPGDSQALPQILGVPSFFVKDYTGQIRLFSDDELKRIYQRLMDVSVQIRSTGASAETCFDAFLQRVCLG